MNIKSTIGLGLQLAIADVKIRFSRTFLGIGWYVLDPVCMFFLFLYIRKIVATGIDNYPIYLLLGLVMFNFFKRITFMSTNLINLKGNLVANHQINFDSIVLQNYLSTLFAHVFEVMILVVVMIIFHQNIIFILAYPLILGIYSVFILGISFILTTVGAYVNDLQNLWNIVLRFLWFATPLFYSSNLDLPISINSFNPIFLFIDISRDIIVYNKMPELYMVVIAIVISIFSFVVGYLIFKRYNYRFAELV